MSREEERGMGLGAGSSWAAGSYEWDAYNAMAMPVRGDLRKAQSGDDLGTNTGGEQMNTLLLPKKKRAVRAAVCQVDGCGKDLSTEKTYLQRYSVCEMHFKADVAVLHGCEVRFCQQCNKFQDIREFEGQRRSCAARAKDRNMRRRLQSTQALHKAASAEGSQLLGNRAAGAQRQQRSGSPNRSGGRQAGSDDSGGQRGSAENSLGAVGGASGMVAMFGRSSLGIDSPMGGRGGGAMWGGPSAGGGGGGDGGGMQGRGGLAQGAQGGGNVWGRGQEPTHSDEAGYVGVGGRYGGSMMGGGHVGGGGAEMGMGGGHQTNSGHSNPHGMQHQQQQGPGMPPGSPMLMEDGISRLAPDDVMMYGGRQGGAVRQGEGTWGARQEVQIHTERMQLPIQVGRGGMQQQQQQPLVVMRQEPMRHGGDGTGMGMGMYGMEAQRGMGGSGGMMEGLTLATSGSKRTHDSSFMQSEGMQAGGMGVGQDSYQQQRYVQQQQQQQPHSQLHEPLVLSRVPTQQQQQQQQQPPSPSLQQEDDLAMLVKERRAALLRQQQLLNQNPGQQRPLQNLLRPMGSTQQAASSAAAPYQTYPHAQPVQQQPHHQQQQEQKLHQEQLQLMDAFGENSFLGLTPAEQLQLRLLAANASTGSHGQGDEGVGPGDLGANSSGSMHVDGGAGAGGAGAGGRGGQHGMGGGGEGGGRGYGGGMLLSGMAVDRSGLQVDRGLPFRASSYGHGSAGNDPMELLGEYGLAAPVAGAGQDGNRNSGGSDRPMGHLGGGSGVVGSGSGGLAAAGGGGMGGYGAAGGGGGGMGYGSGGGSAPGGAGRLLPGLLPGSGGRDDQLAARVCLKLFSCTPEELPGDLQQRLRRWTTIADADAMQIFMRPGCVHLIANVRTPGGQAALERCVLGGGDLEAAVAALTRSFETSGLLRNRRLVVQASEGPRGSYEYDGRLGAGQGVARWVDEAAVAAAPGVVSAMPAALPCGTPTIVALRGRNLLRPGIRIYARCGGRSYELQPLAPQPTGPIADLLLGQPVTTSTPPNAAAAGGGLVSSAGQMAQAAPSATAPTQAATPPRGVSRRELGPPVSGGSGGHPVSGGSGYPMSGGGGYPVSGGSGYPMSGGTGFGTPPLTSGDASAAPDTPTHTVSSSGTGSSAGSTVGPTHSFADMSSLARYGRGTDPGEYVGPSSWESMSVENARGSITGADFVRGGSETGPVRASSSMSAAAADVAFSRRSIQGEPLSPQQLWGGSASGAHPQQSLQLSAGHHGHQHHHQGPQTKQQQNQQQQECVLDTVFVRVPALPRQGLLCIEAVAAELPVMGAWAPAVVCHDREALSEVNGWLRRTADATSARWLLLELGTLLDYDAMLPSLLGFNTAAAAPRAGLGGAGGAAAAPPQQQQLGAAGIAPAPGSMTAAAAANILRQPHGAVAQQQRMEGIATGPAIFARGVSDMAAVAAAVGAGALSAVSYGAAPAVQLPLISGLPDGSSDVSVMASSANPPRDILPVGRSSGADAAQGYGLHTGVAADGVGMGQGVVEGRAFHGLEEEPERSSDHSQGQRSDHTDDTDQVPDAASGRSYLSGRQLSLRGRDRDREGGAARLLSHPLLHPQCRKDMTRAATRLLAYCTATGLPAVATGLLDWLVVMETPAVQTAPQATSSAAPDAALFAASHAAPGDVVQSTAATLAYGRVLRRVCNATAGAATLAAAATEAGTNSGTAALAAQEVLAGGIRRARGSSDGTSEDSSSSGESAKLQGGVCGFAGAGLLHLAVASGNGAMVLAALDWADAYSSPWQLDEPAGHGCTTPLHLAAALWDGGDVARLLLSLGAAGQDAWLTVQDAFGRTPADIAEGAGLAHLTKFCLYGEDESSRVVSSNGTAAAGDGAVAGGAVAAAADDGVVMPGLYGWVSAVAGGMGTVHVVGALIAMLLALLLSLVSARGAGVLRS